MRSEILNLCAFSAAPVNTGEYIAPGPRIHGMALVAIATGLHGVQPVTAQGNASQHLLTRITCRVQSRRWRPQVEKFTRTVRWLTKGAKDSKLVERTMFSALVTDSDLALCETLPGQSGKFTRDSITMEISKAIQRSEKRNEHQQFTVSPEQPRRTRTAKIEERGICLQ